MLLWIDVNRCKCLKIWSFSRSLIDQGSIYIKAPPNRHSSLAISSRQSYCDNAKRNNGKVKKTTLFKGAMMVPANSSVFNIKRYFLAGKGL